jgi:energy-coupling factor transporter ATP-binding protein EcfA2
MNHPFFDALKYPFHRKEAAILHRILIELIQTPTQIISLYRETAALLPLTQPASPADLWLEALDNIVSGGHLPHFCKKLIEKFPEKDVLKNAIEAIEAAQHFYSAKVLPGGIVFLDRKAIREQIEQLADEESPLKVLLVRGESGSGKTHCRYLFETIAKENDGEKIYLSSAFVSTLEDALRHLFSGIGGQQQIPVSNSTDDAWYKVVIMKLNELAIAHKKVLWITVDDLDKQEDGFPLLDSRIKAFFDQLSLQLSAPQIYKNFRLMLIHYPEKVPTRWNVYTYEASSVSAAEIGIADVEEAIREHATRKKKNIMDSQVTELAAAIFADSAHAEADPAWLQRLDTAVKNRLKQIQ